VKRAIVAILCAIIALLGTGVAHATEQPVFYVYFEQGSDQLTADGAQAINAMVARAKAAEADLKAQSIPMRIVIVGYADRSGPAAYNIELSHRRAYKVAETLEGLGIPHDSLAVDWKGESMPKIETPDGAPEPQNRRVEIWPYF